MHRILQGTGGTVPKIPVPCYNVAPGVEFGYPVDVKLAAQLEITVVSQIEKFIAGSTKGFGHQAN